MCADLGLALTREAVSEYNGHEEHWKDVTNGQNDTMPVTLSVIQNLEFNFYF